MIKAHVPCEDAAKAIQAGAQMAASGLFSERLIIEWEEKIHTDKTWSNLKTYYAKLYKSKMQYSKSEAHQTGYENANTMQEAKDKEWEIQLETFMQSVQENATNNTDERNEMREDQNVFVKLGEKMMAQMKT